MVARRDDIGALTAEYVRLRLSYDPETGKMHWLHWPDYKPIWNKQHAGKEAGNINWTGKKKNLPYWRIYIDGRYFRRGRLAWLHVHGTWPKEDIDHIDRDSMNDAIGNLREANRSQNTANKARQSNNSSGYKGVFLTRSGRFLAACGGRRVGLFDSAEAAHMAYATYAKERYGEFARTE